MPRLARLVVPGLPHHVTQRGNRRQQTFFGEGDYALYRHLLAEGCARAGTRIWAWCLMPNHVHLILVPSNEDGLRAAIGEAHRRYTRFVNGREGWRGHLWQERFASFPMDEEWLIACARYVELNPVRAGLVQRPEQWRWSSARSHLGRTEDGVAETAALLERVPNWRELLDGGLEEPLRKTIRGRERTGHALGSAAFLDRLAATLGRSVAPGPRGRPRREKNGDSIHYERQIGGGMAEKYILSLFLRAWPRPAGRRRRRKNIYCPCFRLFLFSSGIQARPADRGTGLGDHGQRTLPRGDSTRRAPLRPRLTRHLRGFA
jgi:putative transposase